MSISFSMAMSRIDQKKISEEEIKEKLNKHKLWLETDEKEGECADFIKLNLEGYDFSNMDLSRANFYGANLRKTKFRNSKLVGAIMINADIGFHSDFEGADMTDVQAMGINSVGANFKNTVLNGADFYRAVLWDTDFKNAKMSEVGSFICSDVADCDFRKADLTGANFAFANFDYTHFEGADCTGTVFSYANNLEWAYFYKTKLDDAVFTEDIPEECFKPYFKEDDEDEG